jgi:hypothetical protein
VQSNRDIELIFPEAIGTTLRKRQIRLPYDLSGRINLLIIAFKHTHYILIEQWSFFLKILQKEFPELKFYEVPTFGILYKFIKNKIEKSMLTKVTEIDSQERMITLFLNKKKFRKDLDIPHEKTIFLFLIDKKGNILWSTNNGITNDKTNQLTTKVRELLEKCS